MGDGDGVHDPASRQDAEDEGLLAMARRRARLYAIGWERLAVAGGNDTVIQALFDYAGLPLEGTSD